MRKRERGSILSQIKSGPAESKKEEELDSHRCVQTLALCWILSAIKAAGPCRDGAPIPAGLPSSPAALFVSRLEDDASTNLFIYDVVAYIS